MDASKVGERQRKSTTLIHREKKRFYEQALTHGHKAVWKAGEQCPPFSPCTSPYAPPLDTTIHKKTSAGAGEAWEHQHRTTSSSSQRTSSRMHVLSRGIGRESRRHDADPRFNDMLHTRNQTRRTAEASATATSGRKVRE